MQAKLQCNCYSSFKTKFIKRKFCVDKKQFIENFQKKYTYFIKSTIKNAYQ